MVNKKNTVFILDFDGVLFDTSLEAYYVMHETHEPGSINKSVLVDQKKYSRFIELRPFVTSAWQYYWVNKYVHEKKDESNYEYYSSEKLYDNNKESEEFEKRFLKNREKLISLNYFNKPVSLPFKFWNLIEPLIEIEPEKFLILSTKDKESILYTLSLYASNLNFDPKRIFCKSDFKKYGSNKHEVFLNEIKPKYSNKFLYIEDSHIHIREFYNEPSVKCIRALWGYVPKNLKQSNSQVNVYKQIVKEFSHE